jgi:hypothetical protein
MRLYKIGLLLLVLMVSAGNLMAHYPKGYKRIEVKKAQMRAFCGNSESQIDQEINNVRARLLGGGDCWWDFTDGRYVVPKVDASTGVREVSAIFAGSVWLGGVDPAKNLKLACQDYRSGNNNDFWSGPLNEVGVTEQFTCKNWDRHFRVTGEEIRQHIDNLTRGVRDELSIPRGVRGWPGRGNPYFTDVWGFDLPFTQQALAGFFDADGDGNYDPLKGDYPSIEIRGCPLDRYPDEMIFWIYNDQGAGAPHANTNGRPIQMEVQVQAFSYVTNDELNDMTFQRYKLINRATTRIDSTFFAMWVDADLGCYTDDYIGCDREKGLMYIYNQDATDGQPGCNCDQGVATYCNDVPILGVDYFRGPLDTFGNELGMSSFMYYNNGSVGSPAAGTTDPSVDFEFYNYLTGSWRDGTRLTVGGNGYAPGNQSLPRTRYALPDPPNRSGGWSMCTANLPFGDRRTLQASGPFTLLPGAVNELIIGVPWVPDAVYPCPDLEQLFRADKLAQGLFDNCFELPDGPDAPKVDWVEMNQELVGVISNPVGNNVNENYAEFDILAPDSLKNHPNPARRESAKYKFEGYIVYQLINPDVSTVDFSDPDKARISFIFDKKNNIKKVFNWEEGRDPNTNRQIFTPVLEVEGRDNGIKHTFQVKDDLFALGNDKRLINHKKYYYAIVSYAYNNYATFDPFALPIKGQQSPFLPGRKGFDGLGIKKYTVIPRPIVDQVLQAKYGTGVPITRLEGVGNGGNFIDMTKESRDALWAGARFDSIINYQPGRGPLKVTIFNPFEVKDGEYEIALVDANLRDNELAADARWQLRRLPNGEIIASERNLSELNEQIVAQFGFSVEITQVGATGNVTPNRERPDLFPLSPGDNNGAIGATVEYENPNQPWLTGVPDQEAGSYFNFVKTDNLERDQDLDPTGALSKIGNGWFVPYAMCDWALPAPPDLDRLITPAWTGRTGATYINNSAIGGLNATSSNSRYRRLNNLPSVDIVLTKDTSKWSRCVIIETATEYYTAPAFAGIQLAALRTESPANRVRQSFDVRFSRSVGKTDANNDGLPDPDNARDAAGNFINGMGWFPGYAVDVETGRRLNIFFGENSCYSRQVDQRFTGRDMLFNPTSQVLRNPGQQPRDYYDYLLGGQHFVYVMYTPYDRCEALRLRFTPELGGTNPVVFKSVQVGQIAWAGLLGTATGTAMRPLREGLIPNDAIIKLRVNSPYQTWYNDADGGRRTGHPRYRFRIQGQERTELAGIQVDNALDSIKVVPNPYYGFSQYENSRFSNIVKITNLPGKSTVTIYSLDGKFIRQYQRNESYAPYRQISPDLEWDLKNNKGIPVASGVYLIHVSSPGMGERTIKWFGVQRQFDPSGL